MPRALATWTNIGVFSMYATCRAIDLSHLQRQPKDVRVRFAHLDRARGDEEIHERAELERAEPDTR